jgi:hypothetical protein
MNVNADEYAPYDSQKAREKSIAEKTAEYLKTRQQGEAYEFEQGERQEKERRRAEQAACDHRMVPAPNGVVCIECGARA